LLLLLLLLSSSLLNKVVNCEGEQGEWRLLPLTFFFKKQSPVAKEAHMQPILLIIEASRANVPFALLAHPKKKAK